MTCRCACQISCPATLPSARNRLTPAASPSSHWATAMRWPRRNSSAPSSGSRSTSPTACRRGTTRVCPGPTGRMSRKATARSVAATKEPSVSPPMIAQKMQSRATGPPLVGVTPTLPDSLAVRDHRNRSLATLPASRGRRSLRRYPPSRDPEPPPSRLSTMPSAALPLLDTAQARSGDDAAVAAGATWVGLMERAAGHLARGTVAAAGGHGAGLRVVLLVGKGNNGGDGWAAARRLRREYGAHCTVVAVDGVDTEVSEAAGANRTAWRSAGGRTVVGTEHLDDLLLCADVAVDCLLGTGSHGAPRGPAGVAVAALRRAHARGITVVACDIPSGVSADDGAAAEAAVNADATVTFGALKRGLLLHPGAAHAGRVLLGTLGSAYDRYAHQTATWSALTPTGAAPAVLDVAADKRARGVVLAVAGAAGTSGAAAL